MDTIMEVPIMHNDNQRSLVNSIVDRLQADHVDLRRVSLGEMKRLIREAQSNSRAASRQAGSRIAT